MLSFGGGDNKIVRKHKVDRRLMTVEFTTADVETKTVASAACC
jgi:hypothetical protein